MRNAGASFKRALPYGILAILATLAYAGSLRNGFVWDDHFFQNDFQWIDSLRRAWDMAFTPLFHSSSYLRPLPLLTLYLEALVSGRSPSTAHAVNLLLHLGVSFLVYRLSLRAALDVGYGGAKSWVVAVLPSALFAVHPALTEAVLWVSSRFDLLATLCMLLGLWLSGVSRGPWIRALLVAMTFFLAALSKESAVVFPVVLVGYFWLRSESAQAGISLRRAIFTSDHLKIYILVLIAGLLYLWVRSEMLGSSALKVGAPSSWERHGSLVAVALSKYLQLTVLPFFGNSLQHTFMWDELRGARDFFPSILLAMLYGTVAVFALFRSRVVGLWLVLPIVAYLPVLHILPLPVGPNAANQRFMYFPTGLLLGLIPYVAHRLSIGQELRRGAVVLGWGFVIVSVLIVRSIVPMWKDDLTLWSWVIRTDPASPAGHGNLITAYVSRGHLIEAERHLEYVAMNELSTGPNVPIDLGSAYLVNGDLERAEYYYDIAESRVNVMLAWQQSMLYAQQARLSLELRRPERVAEYLKRGVAANERNLEVIGQVLFYCEPLDLKFNLGRGEMTRAKIIAHATGERFNKVIGDSMSPQRFCPFERSLP
ncbi:tetratricopeptide repeat protein [Pseudoxanthomonas suwonensis]|uniref:tetratricopeptide repeat protein n=1 Tax=Pseudoxanthomonas suwonensis TaxID=314722 RepID=UPI0004BC84EB|nr:hypothetical protein [Pseudoxanthomonas suwonensis]